MSIIYRYGVSLLSRSSHTKAENEELMIDKETGQILLKRVDGNIMSYDASSRFTTAVDRITKLAASNLTFGKVYNILLDNRDLPSALDINEEILSGDETVVINSVTKLFLQLDVDVYDNESKFGDSKSLENIMVHIDMTHGGSEMKKAVRLLDLNNEPFVFQSSGELIIKSITIDDQEVDSTSHLVINNILALVV